ncbi:MAG: ABC transporter permease subunit [Candidatus Thermoplasmatota archaeon]|nr:ABC transporter permease subunit [Candidatus Thermoplasmatota archaeon]MBS3790541.1 ABC transporter permease subunit [Candidatus Thermoplasmatota archaeon]
MDLKTMRMEFRKGWKGFTIFIFVVVLIVGGMAQLYPVVSETFEEEAGELDGEESLELEFLEEKNEFNLSWEKVEGAKEYIVLEDTKSHMATSSDIGNTTETYMTIPSEDNRDERYFGVVAVVEVEDEESRVPIGMASTVERKTPLEEMMETPYFRMFTAGREDMRIDEIEGYLSVELYSWWILLVGVYLSFLSVKSVTGDYEEGRMDIIFSTPLSRKEYLLQKFSALALFSLALVVLSGLILTLSVYSVGEGFRLNPFLVSIVISWPMLLVIIAVSIFLAVLFKSSRMAVGATFAVILVQYALFMAGHMVESLESVLPFTISYYWDYNSVLLDGVVHLWDLVLLILVAFILFFGSLVLFENRDIPA